MEVILINFLIDPIKSMRLRESKCDLSNYGM